MKKLLAYPLTVLFYIFFGLTLIIFHGIQWFCFNLFGYQAHKKSVDYLNFFLLRSLNVLGTHFTFTNTHSFNTQRPHIIVANHQSQYDIPPIVWHLRRLHPKFISKKELGRGLPSISYNLRHGGSALIDRKDKVQALLAIKQLTAKVKEKNRSIAIFPEGTRSKDGIPSAFAPGGLITLFEELPNAVVVPVTIHNSHKLLKWGGFPMDIGVHIKHTVHKPIEVASLPPRELVKHIQDVVLQDFDHIRPRKKGPTPLTQ